MDDLIYFNTTVADKPTLSINFTLFHSIASCIKNIEPVSSIPRLLLWLDKPAMFRIEKNLYRSEAFTLPASEVIIIYKALLELLNTHKEGINVKEELATLFVVEIMNIASLLLFFSGVVLAKSPITIVRHSTRESLKYDKALSNVVSLK